MVINGWKEEMRRDKGVNRRGKEGRGELETTKFKCDLLKSYLGQKRNFDKINRSIKK